MSDSGDDSDGAGHKRKRIRQACLNCRRKKIKCDGQKPICLCCSRLSQNCQYTKDGRSARAGIRADDTLGNGDESVVDELKSRFTDMEKRFSGLESMLQQSLSAMSNIPTAPSVPPPATQIVTPKSLNSLSMHAPSLSNAQDLMPLSTGTPSIGDAYPSDHMLQFAADVYFRFCHNQPYSLFHEVDFRQRLTRSEVPLYLVWALFAIARRYSTLPDSSNSGSDDVLMYAKKSWNLLKLPWDGSVTDEEVVSICQTIVLLVNVEHTAGQIASSFMKLGFALRLALCHQLHISPKHDLPAIFKEERKRTFWSLYLQDKLMCLSRNRLCILREEECRIQLPCSEHAFRNALEEDVPTLDCFVEEVINEDAVQKCGPLALIIVMATTLTRVSTYVLSENRASRHGPPWSTTSPYSSISSNLMQLELHFRMNSTYTELLTEKCSPNGNVDQALAGPMMFAKALFHLNHCLLHHPFLLQQCLSRLNLKAPVSFARRAWETCRTHAQLLTGLNDVRKGNVLVITSLYGYCTMVAGTIHVIASNDQDQAIRESGLKHHTAAVEFLHELGQYWRHALLMANRLERFQRHIQGHRSLANLDLGQSENLSADIELLWQSIDYSSLCTPTPPTSPPPETFDQLSATFPTPGPFFEIDAYGYFESLGDTSFFPGTEHFLLQDPITAPL